MFQSSPSREAGRCPCRTSRYGARTLNSHTSDAICHSWRCRSPLNACTPVRSEVLEVLEVHKNARMPRLAPVADGSRYGVDLEDEWVSLVEFRLHPKGLQMPIERLT